MAKFTKRLSAPTPTDKEWLHYSVGGTNRCIKVNGNSCLPNCVGYAWGRLTEILGKTPPVSCGNAEDWWDYKDGLSRGQTPKLGAVICCAKGRAHHGADGAGHVAIVEEIKSNGDIVISQSGYRASNGATAFNANFKTLTITKASGYSYGAAYTFQGFIYCGIEFDDNSIPVVKPDIPNNYQIGDTGKLKPGAYWATGKKPSSWVYNAKLTVIEVRSNGILVVSKDGLGGAVTGTILPDAFQCNSINGSPITPSNPKKTSLNIGEAVTFTGTAHYTSSYKTATKKSARPCKAKVTAKNTSSNANVTHPYHLVGDGVHGWVNKADIAELN
jgi:surface antigen